MKRITIIIIAIFIFASCNTSKNTVQQINYIDEECEAMTYNKSPVSNISSDYYQVDTLFIANNCLNIWVSYGGGCGISSFNLYYNDKVQNSVPPKTILRFQITDEDPCKATVQQKLYYNLSFFDDYYNQDGILFELSESKKSVLYKK